MVEEPQANSNDQNGNVRHTKVARFRILKPAAGMTWNELGKMLRDVRYRVFRLANLAVSENYLAFHLWRTGQSDQFQTAKISELNKRLRKMLEQEQQRRKGKSKGTTDVDPDRFSKGGALPDTVVGALSQYKISALTSRSKWREVITGKASLPTFRNDLAIPVRGDKPERKRLERVGNGDVELDLMICLKPYPRVILQTGDVGGSLRAILDRMLDNPSQSLDGYRQRYFEVKQDRQSNKWWLHVTYDFPASNVQRLDKDIIVGVDVGFSCPLYAAINNGHARLGWKAFKPLGNSIRSLQRQVMARRRDIQRGGTDVFTRQTARGGHGRRRKLQAIETLEGRIEKAYNTLNHQLSSAVIDFAENHGAGVIQVEDLEGLKEELRGTFIGGSWRYHQLQQFLEYKAKHAGIEFRKVNPQYTSRRCSKCGVINAGFDRRARDAAARPGYSARFQCTNEECDYFKKPVDADYNAARNLATLDIEAIIRRQCKIQGIEGPSASGREAVAL